MQGLEMIWAEVVLLFVGALFGAAILCAGAAFAIYKLLGDDDYEI